MMSATVRLIHRLELLLIVHLMIITPYKEPM